MSKPRDRRALAKAKAEGMDRFLRDYDAWWHRIRKEAADREFESGQYILNLETDDDD